MARCCSGHANGQHDVERLEFVTVQAAGSMTGEIDKGEQALLVPEKEIGQISRVRRTVSVGAPSHPD